MLSIAHCPRCEERVRVPDVEGPAEVRCPWCGEAFELDEVTIGLPPMLEIVSLPAANEVFENFESASSPDLDVQVAESDEDFRISGSSPYAEPMEFTKRKKRRSSSSRSRGRRSRRYRDSPVVGFLKMAGGGVAGILIAMLILQSINRLPNLGFWPFRGPGNRIFSRVTTNPSTLSPTLENSSTWETDASNPTPATSNAEPDEAPPELPDPIDLGATDFAKTETEDSGDAAATVEASVEQVTELLNDYIRTGSSDSDVALAIQSMLASMDVESTEVKEQLDSFVDRLIYEKELLRRLLEESRSDIDLVRWNPPAKSNSRHLALVGRIIDTDDGLALQTSNQENEALLLDNTAGNDDVKKQATVMVIGTIQVSDQKPRLSIRYGKSLSTR